MSWCQDIQSASPHPHFSVSGRHAALLNPPPDSEGLSACLLPDPTDFQRAGMLTHICAQLLRTLRDIDYESTALAEEESQRTIVDLTCSKREPSDPVALISGSVATAHDSTDPPK